MERPPRGLSEICSDEKRSLELHLRRISLACLRKPWATRVRFCFVEASGIVRLTKSSSTVIESVLLGGSVITVIFKPYHRAPIRGAKSSPPARAYDRLIDLSCFRAAF